jgi:hypothetical protein
VRVVGLLIVGVASSALAADQRYDGPRLAFVAPADAKIREATDIVGDYALDVALKDGGTLRLVLSKRAVADSDVETVAGSWREARIKNRSSWGVKKKAAGRPDLMQIGGKWFVRFVDQMGSVLGNESQVMICGSVSNKLLCGIANAPKDRAHGAEAILVRLLESTTVKKR